MDNTVKTKICSRCGANKQKCEYYNNPLSKDGLYEICKDCFNFEVNKKHVARQEKKRASKINTSKKNRYYDVVTRAIRRGELKKKPCEQCGSTKKIHAHHEDYSKPLDVVWLCHKCHFGLHKKKRQQEVGE